MNSIIETPDFIYVFINNLPYYDTEIVDKEKGIVRIYGRDGDKMKINYVKYPTKHYTKEYIEKYIIQQYDDCQLCKVGKNIEKNVKIKDELKNILPIKINKKVLGIGAIVGILSIIPFSLLLLRKRLTDSES